jgi:Transposase IS66 family
VLRLAKLSQKSDVAVAIRYALERWSALLRFSEDGRVEMDNNAAERALQAVRWDARTVCLRDRMWVTNERQRSTVCWDRPS